MRTRFLEREKSRFKTNNMLAMNNTTNTFETFFDIA